MNETVALTREGLFFVLGKLVYVEQLLCAQFDEEEGQPVGVEQALLEIELAKDPLFRILLGPPDTREAFAHYLKETYEIDIKLEVGIEVTDELVANGPRLSVVSGHKQS